MTEDKNKISRSMVDSIKKSTEVLDSGKSESDADQSLRERNDIILNLIYELKVELNNEIPLIKLHEKSGYDLSDIQESLMQLLMEKKFLGFINDQSTPDLSDDILIVREKRILDELEPEYRVG
ncbi:MAG: hypothetical protein IH840_10005 [Candidatus Heimdallarchaeota archaeon]|nr:hypothetical protein [Candidatus Heimdallarchaeota archaeon]